MKNILKVMTSLLIVLSNLSYCNINVLAEESNTRARMITCPYCGGEAVYSRQAFGGFCTLDGKSYTRYYVYYDCTNCFRTYVEEILVRDN